MRMKTNAHKEIPTVEILARLAEFSLRLGEMTESYMEQMDSNLKTTSICTILTILRENVVGAIDNIEAIIPDGEVEFFENLLVKPSSCIREMVCEQARRNPQYKGRIE